MTIGANSDFAVLQCVLILIIEACGEGDICGRVSQVRHWERCMLTALAQIDLQATKL